MKGQYFGQFVISRREQPVPSEYDTMQLGPWVVNFHASLSLVYIYTRDGRTVGCMLGRAIDVSQGVFITHNVLLPFDNSDLIEEKERAVHEFLRQLGGRFVCMIVDNDIQRLYLDAAGSLSCVYATNQEVVASTPGLILGEAEYYSSLDTELAESVNISKTGWYPGGVTPHPSICRVLPNHYLDLCSWKAVRYWPVAKIPIVECVEDSVRTIRERIKASVRAVTRTNKAYLPITAGRDSRMLLACARDCLDSIRFITFVDGSETVDEYIVKRLDAAYHLNVQYIPIEYASSEQREHWYAQVGHCVGGKIAEIHQTLSHLNNNYMIMPGLAGEVGRAYYWKSRDREDTPITANELLRRFNLPAHAVLLRAVDGWLEELGDMLDAFQLLDIAYIEHRLGAWGGPQTYGQTSYMDHIYPMSQRVIFEEILSLPPGYKLGNRLPIDIIGKEWPELLNLPFNRYIGFRNWIENAKRLRRLPAKIAKTIGFRQIS